MIINAELARSKGHLSKDLWETPRDLFEKLDAEFNFTLDPCATNLTAKCKKYYTPESDGMSQDWSGEICFVNPPYSRRSIDKWVHKCFLESRKPNTTVVALLPVSTSSSWFHDHIYKQAEIRFIKRRVRFVGAPFTAPFSSMIVIWKQ